MESDVKEELKTKGAWRVEEDDEARYNFSNEKGLWQPKPEDILSMFEELAKGGALPLQWTCPGRRAPESLEEAVKKEETEMEVGKEESREEESREPEPCAFDFDDTQSESGMKTTPMRALGGPGRTPRTEKRVARMDNIMDSLRKQQIQRAAEREARRAKASPGRTPQGRGGRLLKFGGSPMSQSPKNVVRPEVKKAAPVMAIGQSPPAACGLTRPNPTVVSTSLDPSMSMPSSSVTILSSSLSTPIQSTSTVSVSDASSLTTTVRSSTTNSLSKSPNPEQQHPKPSESDTKSLLDGLKNIPLNLPSMSLPTDSQTKLHESDNVKFSQPSSENPKTSAAVSLTNSTTTSTLSSSVSVANNLESSKEEISPTSIASAPSPTISSNVSHMAVSTIPLIQSVITTASSISASSLPSSTTNPPSLSISTHPTNPTLPALSATNSDKNESKPSTQSATTKQNPSLNSALILPSHASLNVGTPALGEATPTANDMTSSSDNSDVSYLSSVLPPKSSAGPSTAMQQRDDQQKSANTNTSITPNLPETPSLQGDNDRANRSL